VLSAGGDVSEERDWIALAAAQEDAPADPVAVCASSVCGRPTKHIWGYSGRSLGRMVALLVQERDALRAEVKKLEEERDGLLAESALLRMDFGGRR
jgi:hypothetical protein